MRSSEAKGKKKVKSLLREREEYQVKEKRTGVNDGVKRCWEADGEQGLASDWPLNYSCWRFRPSDYVRLLFRWSDCPPVQTRKYLLSHSWQQKKYQTVAQSAIFQIQGGVQPYMWISILLINLILSPSHLTPTINNLISLACQCDWKINGSWEWLGAVLFQRWWMRRWVSS